MKKLSEKSILEYFKCNNKICLDIEIKQILLDSRLKYKDSIIRRLCYLVNECNWTYAWFNCLIPTPHPTRFTKVETYY